MINFGELVELVDTTGSGSVASRRESSNLLFPTIFILKALFKSFYFCGLNGYEYENSLSKDLQS